MTPAALELEQRIQEAGALVEKHQMNGHNQKAREAFAVVRELVAQRTPETVEEMERDRDLQRLDQIEAQREATYQESLREL
jgi:hypothetical protein